MTDTILGTFGIYAGMFVVGVLTGLVFFIPGEIALAAAVLLAGDVGSAVALGVLVAAGQMVAKGILYQGAHGAAKLAGAPDPDGKLARAKKWVDRWKDKPLGLTFVSALVGLPPLYVISLLAGVLGIRFRAFMALGMAGRSLRFVTIAVFTLYARGR